MLRFQARIVIGMMVCLLMQIAPLSLTAPAQAHSHHASMTLCHDSVQSECLAQGAFLPMPAPHSHEKCCATHGGMLDSVTLITRVFPALPNQQSGASLPFFSAWVLKGADRLPLLRPPKPHAL
mgnify:CR=1 FL=1